MARLGLLYAVVDTEANTFVRSGIYSTQVFESIGQAKEVAEKYDKYEAVKLEEAELPA